tara:strand:+ start:53 stop:949 length:897 start_codon:yes stop_codon:yes gene_type:complete
MKGWIYIIQSGEDEKYKIGCTEKNPNKRLKELDKTGNPDILKLIEYFEVEDMYLVEKEIHNQLKEYRIRRDREWFKIDLKELKHIVYKFIENFKINEINNKHMEREDIQLLIEFDENIKFEDISINAERYYWDTPIFFTESKTAWDVSNYKNWKGPNGIPADINFEDDGPGRLWERAYYIFTFSNHPKNKKLEKIKFNIKEEINIDELKKFINLFSDKLKSIDIRSYLNNTSFPQNITHLQYALSYLDFSGGDFNKIWKKWNHDLYKRTRGKISLINDVDKFFFVIREFLKIRRNNNL